MARHIDVRQRAAEVFAVERVWDTEENSGILIYVELADRRVEILADRGIAARVPQVECGTRSAACTWSRVSRRTVAAGGARRRGTRRRVAAGALSAGERNPNELSDRPLML